MSYAVLPEAVIQAWPALSFKAKSVVVAIASFMDGEGRCYPSREAIRRRAGLHRRDSVSAAISELAKSVLEVARRPNSTSVYSWSRGVEVRKNRPPGSTGKPYTEGNH